MPLLIYNVDETGLAYEHIPQKVVTLKGQKKEGFGHPVTNVKQLW